MKNGLLFIFIFLNFLSTKAQQIIPLNERKYEDSLMTVLHKKIADSAKINAMLLLSDFHRTTDSVSSRKYLELAKKSSSGNPFLQAKIFYTEGQFYKDRNPEKAALYYKKSIKILENINHKEAYELLAISWMNFAISEKNKEGYPYLVKIITEKSIPLLQTSKNETKLGNMFSQLGIIFTYNADFKNAQKYIDNGIELLEKTAPNSTELFIAYMNSVSNYCYQAKGDEAKKMLAKAEKIIAPFPDSTNNSLFYYGKMLTHITKQENDKAFDAAKKGLVFAEQKNQAMLAQMFYFNQYDILQKRNEYSKAREVLEKVLQSKLIMSDMRNRKTVYAEMININEKMHNYPEALQWSRQFNAVSDSIQKSNLDEEIKHLDAKFSASEKERLLSNKELEISQKKKYLWILGLLSLLLLCSASFIYINSKNKRKIAQQREINLQQQLKDKEQTEQLKLTKAILDGEERERERVAKDLHDGLGGMLAGVKINLSTWSNNNLEEDQYESFHRILNQLDSSVSELRRVARNLMPESLLNFGLEIALKDLCEFYMKDDLQIDFQAINIEKNLPLNLQVNIYRIVQELLNNAVKHSEANNILVQCSQNGSEFYITVEDNGKGIQETEMNKLKSLGLKNLKNRINFLKGKMEIQSAKDQGTSINIELNTNVA